MPDAGISRKEGIKKCIFKAHQLLLGEEGLVRDLHRPSGRRISNSAVSLS